MANQSSSDLDPISTFQRGVISFVNTLNPNTIRTSDAVLDVIWPKFGADVSPAKDDVCSFIKAKNTEFMR